MNKIILALFSLALVLLSISFSSALCLNCNQLNPQVQYYQNANGCSVYSPAVNYQTDNIRPVYSINQPYSMHTIVQYHQTYQHHGDEETDSDSNSKESKCNWHMLFYRSC